MEIKGSITRVDALTITVNPSEVFEKVLSELKLRNKHLRPFDHISDGIWQEFWFEDGHNGDEHYKKARAATEDEMVFDKLLKDVHEAFYRN